ncbi:MAG: polynucleotide kinase-phosphatase [Phycisphaerales bacterium]
MNIKIPELSLVVLIGASGSGKSTLARRLFKPTEILSSDTCRAWVSDDELNQEATGDAFDVLHYIARKRLARGLLTVIDATNVRGEDRRPLVKLAREFHFLPVAIVVDTPEHVCHDRNRERPDRQFGPHVVRNQRIAIRRELRGLQREGFRNVHTLRTIDECDAAALVREPLWNNLKHERGPFDIIGDVHGCYQELLDLLGSLGWTITQREGEPEGCCDAAPPGAAPIGASSASEGDPPTDTDTPTDSNTSTEFGPPRPSRRLIFLGDLVDRGPATPSVLRLAMTLCRDGLALCVPGNHDVKLLRALRGKNVQITHGLAESLAQLAGEPESFRREVAAFIDAMVSHYLLDGGRLVVAHAGMKESMQGRGSGAVREFALYGETTGETDEFGLPVRYNWAAEYRGKPAVVYGHTPVPHPEWLNGTVCIDTGCVFGGSLTALRWPEREFVSVRARATYAEPRRPFLEDHQKAPLSLQQQHDDLLDLEDVSGKRHIETRLVSTVTVRQENAAAALEVMSRFACDPRWLIYLPPTMSPCETSCEGPVLEHPREAFEYFRMNGVGRVICEEKHMGSRAVAIVCREPEVVRSRFGIEAGGDAAPLGTIYTRTGRPFFADAATEQALLARVRDAATRAGLWDELATDWLCLDCELMPWSAKAQGLIREQYASVGAAATSGLSATVEALQRTLARVPDAADLLEAQSERLALVSEYTAAYRRYCWDVAGVEDLRLAPFHLLASEGKVHVDRDHAWHMGTLARLADPADPVLVATPLRIVDLSSQASEQEATDWWSDLTAGGGEGMVVKPLEFIARGPRGLIQPAIKVRGVEYLRIIYGPEYTRPEHLERLRARRLGTKRTLAMREFALGIESLERFVRREPLRRVHECVFAVLAMESEPVDPRL